MTIYLFSYNRRIYDIFNTVYKALCIFSKSQSRKMPKLAKPGSTSKTTNGAGTIKTLQEEHLESNTNQVHFIHKANFIPIFTTRYGSCALVPYF